METKGKSRESENVENCRERERERERGCRLRGRRTRRRKRQAQLCDMQLSVSPPTKFGGFPRQNSGKGPSEEQRVGLSPGNGMGATGLADLGIEGDVGSLGMSLER